MDSHLIAFLDLSLARHSKSVAIKGSSTLQRKVSLQKLQCPPSPALMLLSQPSTALFLLGLQSLCVTLCRCVIEEPLLKSSLSRVIQEKALVNSLAGNRDPNWQGPARLAPTQSTPVADSVWPWRLRSSDSSLLESGVRESNATMTRLLDTAQ